MSRTNRQMDSRAHEGTPVSRIGSRSTVTASLLLLLLLPGAAHATENIATTLATSNVDSLWVLMAACMVFFMQAGFLIFEVGAVRPLSATSVAMKNLIDWAVVSLVFVLVGFGLMFGQSAGGIIGTDLFGLVGMDQEGASSLGMIFFLFQLAFACTAATIVSGAMSERTGFATYLVVSLAIGLVAYPVYGHWAWGSLYLEGSSGWLENLGFMDFAGSSVVHSLGGWVALVGVWFLGPRIGRYSADGSVNALPSNGLAFSALGVFILWFGWWGFNGGSALELNADVGHIIVVTNICACAAGIAAFTHCWFRQDKWQIYEKFMGGTLGGLVAITACCNVVSPLASVFIGLGAGVVHNWCYDLMAQRWKLDDPVGAVPVHLACGIYGTLCVALFGNAELLANPRWQQLWIQGVGIAACAAWAVPVSAMLFYGLKHTVGLRVPPDLELDGIQIERRTHARDHEEEEKETLDMDELAELMGE